MRTGGGSNKQLGLEKMSQLDVQGMEETAMQFPKQSADHNQRA
jgi:hypothetical protein